MAKVITKKLNLSDSNTMEMFNSMLGLNGVDVEFAWPKFRRLREGCEKITDVIGIFYDTLKSTFAATAELRHHSAEFAGWINFARDQLSTLYNFVEVNEANIEQFKTSYEQIKSNSDGILNSYIVMCDRLVVHRAHLESQSQSLPAYFENLATIEVKPFTFSNFNIKYIFSLPEIGGQLRSFICLALHKLYVLSYKLYKDYSEPEVDVEVFISMITENIKAIKKIPELSRCNKAFKKIEESVFLIRNNFDTYYKDFITAKDPALFIENYILDVSNNTKQDAETMLQYRRIIEYFKKSSANRPHNPKVDALFNRINSLASKLPNLKDQETIDSLK